MGSNPVHCLIFFRPYFYDCLRSVHYSKDRFHFHILFPFLQSISFIPGFNSWWIAHFFFLERGRCVAPYKCDCAPGWTGASCALFDCAGVNQCSGQGVCVSSNTCRCYPGFQGANCNDVVDCEILGNCSGNGVCIQGGNDGNVSCRYKASLLS